MKRLMGCVVAFVLASSVGSANDEEKKESKVCAQIPFYCLEYCVFHQPNYHIWVAVEHNLVFCTETAETYVQTSNHPDPIPQDCLEQNCYLQSEENVTRLTAATPIELVPYPKTFHETLPTVPEKYGLLEWKMADATEVQSDLFIQLNNVDGATIFFKLYLLKLDANPPLLAAAKAKGIPASWIKPRQVRIARVGFQVKDIPPNTKPDYVIEFDKTTMYADEFTLKLTPPTYKQPFFVKTKTSLGSP